MGIFGNEIADEIGKKGASEDSGKTWITEGGLKQAWTQ